MTNIKALTVLVATMVSVAIAQVPNVGWCPDYLAMPDFDMERFMGTWYEQERYFAILEAGSRCVRTNYTKAVDGRILVSNEVTNRLTGIKRVLDGEIRNLVKGAEAKLSVKYSTLPYPFETSYTILDTDYDNHAVIWSCSGLGLVNTQNAWIMTRERLAPGTILQRAYGVLDRFKINRAFFVKTDQADCQIAEAINENDVNKEGAADKNKEDAEKNKRNKNTEKGNVKSAAGVVAEPAVAVEKEQQQQQVPAEPKKPAVVVESVVHQDQPAAAAAVQQDEKQSAPAPVEAVKEPVVADPIPVKQSSVVAADAVKKQ